MVRFQSAPPRRGRRSAHPGEDPANGFQSAPPRRGRLQHGISLKTNLELSPSREPACYMTQASLGKVCVLMILGQNHVVKPRANQAVIAWGLHVRALSEYQRAVLIWTALPTRQTCGRPGDPAHGTDLGAWAPVCPRRGASAVSGTTTGVPPRPSDVRSGEHLPVECVAVSRPTSLPSRSMEDRYGRDPGVLVAQGTARKGVLVEHFSRHDIPD